MAKNTTAYNADDIKVLEGLDAVRLRPGMYIGTTGIKGLHHILWEIVDNAVDEAANGFADKISVILNADGSVSVEDNGRGIPTDIHPKMKVSGVEVVFTQLHAGGKFDEHNYAYSGGLHGVGASVANALSEWLKVEVYKDGTTYAIEFESITEGKKIRSGIPKAPLKNTKVKTDKHGTFVQFKPDKRVFETVEFSFEMVSKRLRELAFLNKGLEITLEDKRDIGFLKKVYKFDGGIKDYINYINEGKNKAFPEPIFYSTERDNIKIEYAIQYISDSYTESIISFVNNIPTPEGGTHETGFKSGLTRVLNDYARREGYLKEKDANFLGEDFREGITTIISIKMNNIQFEGQTKTKLGNPEARMPCEAAVVEGLDLISREKKMNPVFEAIMKKAQQAAKVRLATRQAKDIARAKSSIEAAPLVGKLSACTGRKAERNELFIVEGDSAGGSAKQGRTREFQAILPLRGKPLNAEKKRLDQVLLNEEYRTLISALGAGIGEDFDINALKYHKIIILSDADQDGAHIRALLLAFFFRYMKELINEGHIYIGMPPLYKVYKKDVVEYAYDDKELQSKIEKVGKGYSLQRYKGLGEMNPEQLWDTTLNPATRCLMRVTLEDAAEAEKKLSTLLGDNIEARKAYISEYANFNKIDTFMDKIKD